MRSLAQNAEALLGLPVASIEPAEAGRNGRVHRITVASGQRLALKTYFRHDSDVRPRLRTEFDALRFLWTHGERRIPQAIAASERDDVMICQWIDGEPIGVAEAEATRGAADFLISLARLRGHAGAAHLAPASEACFSGLALLANLRCRLQPLQAVPALSSYLAEEMLPAFQHLTTWSASRMGSSFEEELAAESRTLSPSDFGFHNALQTEHGIVFFDFEYFGWDDPAKMVCDFVLHPGFSVSPTLKKGFVAAILREFPDACDRVAAFYPLFGLKWCMILLNEFLPTGLLRRRFAGLSEQHQAVRQAEQLGKARAMLQVICATYDRFPYVD